MSRKDIENECFQYVKSITDKNVQLKQLGLSNSSYSDIEVLVRGYCFYIEIKESESQAGQFVIEKKENNFKFSDKNKSKFEPCEPILEFINKNISLYENIGTRPIEVNVPQSLMYKRIIDYYVNEKKAIFFVTTKENEFFIFKTNDLSNYFDIKCVVRRKKSGSSHIPLKDYELVKKYVTEYLDKNGVANFNFYSSNNSLFLNILSKKEIKKLKLKSPNLNYSIYLSKHDNFSYELKKLSKTNNINVIFTLKLKNCQLISQVEEYVDFVKHININER